MITITIPQKDKGYNYTFTITESDGTAFNLAGYTIKLKVWQRGKPDVLLVNGACTIVNAAAGTCTYLLTGTDFTAEGTYLGEIELTQTGIIQSTVNIQVIVQESGG